MSDLAHMEDLQKVLQIAMKIALFRAISTFILHIIRKFRGKMAYISRNTIYDCTELLLYAQADLVDLGMKPLQANRCQRNLEECGIVIS